MFISILFFSPSLHLRLILCIHPIQSNPILSNPILSNSIQSNLPNLSLCHFLLLCPSFIPSFSSPLPLSLPFSLSLPALGCLIILSSSHSHPSPLTPPSASPPQQRQALQPTNPPPVAYSQVLFLTHLTLSSSPLPHLPVLHSCCYYCIYHYQPPPFVLSSALLFDLFDLVCVIFVPRALFSFCLCLQKGVGWVGCTLSVSAKLTWTHTHTHAHNLCSCHSFCLCTHECQVHERDCHWQHRHKLDWSPDYAMHQKDKGNPSFSIPFFFFPSFLFLSQAYSTRFLYILFFSPK